MKKLLMIFAATLLCISAFAQNGRSIYNKYSDARGVSAVYISPAMFRLIGKVPDMEIGKDKINLTSVIQSLSGLYIIDSENADVNEDIRREVKKFVKGGNYEPLMEMKDSGEIVSIFTAGKDDLIESLVFLSESGPEYTFICLDRKMSREDFEALLASAMED